MKFEEKLSRLLSFNFDFIFVFLCSPREGIKRLIDICFGGVENVECRYCIV